MGWFVAVLSMLLYFLPTFIGQSKRNAGAIFTLNLLLGWTVVGWLVAIIRAMTVDTAPMAGIAVPPIASYAIVFCAGCGANLQADSRFCAMCGRRASS